MSMHKRLRVVDVVVAFEPRVIKEGDFVFVTDFVNAVKIDAIAALTTYKLINHHSRWQVKAISILLCFQNLL